MLFLLVILLGAFISCNEDLHLIEVDKNVRMWVTQSQMLKMRLNGESFFDVTNFQDSPSAPLAKNQNYEYPSSLHMEHVVDVMSTQITQESMTKWLTDLCTTFNTRYAGLEEGLIAAEYIEKQYTDFIATLPADRQSKIHVERHEAGKYDQFSVIVTLEGSTLPDELVIIGGHLDSIANDVNDAPGCDDDGTGAVTVFEVFKVIAKSTFLPARSLQFMSFAAEEVGLVGSNNIAYDYQREGKEVYAMLNIDMTGYHKEQPYVTLIQDYTDSNLNEFVKLCIDRYSTLKYTEGKCGYGCSDHASFNKMGYPSSFPFERTVSPYIHQNVDTMDNLDMAAVFEWAKFSLGFMVELGVDEK